jgi:hypothetical protein
MLRKVLRFDRSRRTGAGERRVQPLRQPDDWREEAHGSTRRPEDDEEPRGFLSLVSVRVLRDDDDTEP